MLFIFVDGDGVACPAPIVGQDKIIDLSIQPDRIICPRIVQSFEVSHAVWSGFPCRRRATLAANPSRKSRRARCGGIRRPCTDRAALRAWCTPMGPNRLAAR